MGEVNEARRGDSARAAIDAIEKAMEGVTPGPWQHIQTGDGSRVKPDIAWCGHTSSQSHAETGANAAYIAACSPNRMREVLSLARQAEALQRENAELRKKLDACDWYWPEDDTSSDACADGPLQSAENCDLPPGEVLAYSRGGVVETRFYAYLPPADDSDSDDEFEVDAETELAVKQAIEAETARRARALLGGENAGN